MLSHEDFSVARCFVYEKARFPHTKKRTQCLQWGGGEYDLNIFCSFVTITLHIGLMTAQVHDLTSHCMPLLHQNTCLCYHIGDYNGAGLQIWSIRAPSIPAVLSRAHGCCPRRGAQTDDHLTLKNPTKSPHLQSKRVLLAFILSSQTIAVILDGRGGGCKRRACLLLMAMQADLYDLTERGILQKHVTFRRISTQTRSPFEEIGS